MTLTRPCTREPVGSDTSNSRTHGELNAMIPRGPIGPLYRSPQYPPPTPSPRPSPRPSRRQGTPRVPLCSRKRGSAWEEVDDQDQLGQIRRSSSRPPARGHNPTYTFRLACATHIRGRRRTPPRAGCHIARRKSITRSRRTNSWSGSRARQATSTTRVDKRPLSLDAHDGAATGW